MTDTTRVAPAARFAGAQVVLLVVVVALSAQQPPDPAKKPADPPKALAPAPKEKDTPKTAAPVGVRLPDGTFLWTGPGGSADGERVLLTPQELQKLLDQVDQLKKQVAAKKAAPPSGCAIRGRVEKRGDTFVAALKVTYSFRTAAPDAAVALGGKRGFLVAASLDGNKLPVLDTGEDGFAATVEAAGDHTLTLDLESPVAGRGKTEIGFELGLPRAAITTLALDPPPGVARVNLATRTPDPARPADPRRVVAVDAKQLAPRPGGEGYPLGPVDVVEVTWELPAAAPPADPAQSAEIDVTCLLAEGFVETTARVRPRGPARAWRVAAPADAVVAVDRLTAAPPADPGATAAPVVTKPADPNKPVWKVDLPAGTAAADWVVTAVTRGPRPRATDPKHKGPFPVGPFAVLDVSRQGGTVRVTAAANTRLTVKHGPDVRPDVPPAAAGDEAVAYFRFATGPTGAAPPPAPLLDVSAEPLRGVLEVRPAYKLTLAESGWQVRADVRVVPIRRDVDTLQIDLPAGWRGANVGPPEVVEGVQQGAADGPRQPLAVRLAAAHKQPFDLVLTATVPTPPGAKDVAVAFPRYPGASERDATVVVTAPGDVEVRGSGRAWDGDQPAAWGRPLAPADPPVKGATTLAGTFEHGLSRADLAWSPHRPELTADVRADVTVHDGQVVVRERVTLRAPGGFPAPVRFRGPARVDGLKAAPPLDPAGAGEWVVALPPTATEATVTLAYAVPHPPRPAGGGYAVPVGLLWPAAATRAESVVRVWSNLGPGRAVGAAAGPWRELPPEPPADRDALPVLTLAGSGADLPLALDVAETPDAAAAAWVDRGLIQVSVGGDDGATARARFLLTRWLADAVEVALPDGLAGDPPAFLLDGRKVEATPVPGTRAVRVPLPEAKVGRAVVLEVRYRLAAGRGVAGAWLAPPVPKATTGPVRWQVTVPGGNVPLVSGGGRAEQRWAARSLLFAPAPTSAESLERWFQTDADADDGAGPPEAAVVRADGPGAVHVFCVPRVGLVVAASVGVLVVGLILSRLPGGAAGPAVAVLGGAAAIGAVLYPQPAGQIAGAAEPGAAALAVVLAVRAAARWYYRRRVTHLPGFTRTRVEPPTPLPAAAGGSARARPSRFGSTGAPDGVAAEGGA